METSSQFIRLLVEDLRDVAEAKFKDLPTMIPRLYNMTDSTSAWEEFFEVGAVPDIPEFTGQLTALSVAPGYHTKIEHKEYGGFLSIERKLMDDKKYGVLQDRGVGLMESAHRVREKQGARIFQNAFSSAFDYMTREENVSLCSSSHTTKSGTSTSSGFDNSGTSALSKTNVAATRILMRGFKNDISERINVGDDLALIVPDNLADTAEEIVGTVKGLDTGDGNINPQYGRYKVIPYLRLDDTDTNNWFMVWESQMKKDLLWFDRIMPELKTQIDFMTLVSNQSVYFRCSNGFRDWRWIYGHIVS